MTFGDWAFYKAGPTFFVARSHHFKSWVVLALEMGMGVPPELTKPDRVTICLMAQKTPCPNFRINTEFNWLVYGVITTNLLHVLTVFSSSLIFCAEKLRLSAVRLGHNDGILLKMVWEISNKHAKAGAKAGSSKRHPVPILEAQKRHPVPKLEAQKGILSSGTSPVLCSFKQNLKTHLFIHVWLLNIPYLILKLLIYF